MYYINSIAKYASSYFWSKSDSGNLQVQLQKFISNPVKETMQCVLDCVSSQIVPAICEEVPLLTAEDIMKNAEPKFEQIVAQINFEGCNKLNVLKILEAVCTWAGGQMSQCCRDGGDRANAAVAKFHAMMTLYGMISNILEPKNDNAAGGYQRSGS